MTAGERNKGVSFQKRGADGQGRAGKGAFAEQFQRRAKVLYPVGGETVMQQRLQGKAPAILTVPEDEGTRTIATSWRAELLEWPNHLFEVKSVAPGREPRTIDLTCEALALG